MRRRFRPYLFALLWLPQLLAAQPAFQGVWDLRSKGPCDLEPTETAVDWAFYGNRLLKPELFQRRKAPTPDEYAPLDKLWNDRTGNYVPENSQGVATYHLRIISMGNCRSVGFSLPDMYTAYNFWVNGQLVASNGLVSDNEDTYFAHWLPRTEIYEGRTDTMNLVLQIANFSHHRGGTSQQIVLGNAEKIMSDREKAIAYDLFLTGGLIMGGLFFLGLFLFDRRDKATLYFALFCIAYSYRVIGAELYFLHQAFPWLPYWLTIRLEYISLYLSLVLFAFFVLEIFPKETNPKIIRFFGWTNVGFIGFTLFGSAYWFTQLFTPYLAFVGLYLVYGLYVIFTALFHKREGAPFAFASILFLMLSFFLLMLDHLQVVPYPRSLILVGYFGFFFSQSLVLSFRFGKNLFRMHESARASERAKYEFLSGISHELRTPLNAIQGMSEMLLREDLPDRVQEQAHAIKTQAEVLSALILDLISADDREDDIDRTNEEEFLVQQLLDSTTKLVDHLKSNGVNFGTSVGPDVPARLKGDAVRLRRILQHLLTNAFKFTDTGMVFLKVGLESRDEHTHWISFQIEDTGKGISNTDLERVFKAFSNLDANKSKETAGAGLGLALVKQLTERVGGSLKVNSIPGKGSTFKVTLPFAMASNGPSLFQSEPTLVLDPDLKVMVVDDNRVNLKLMEMMFRQLGLVFYAANSGEDALEFLKETHFDVVFMDLQMPGMDGWETAAKMREIPRRQPVIIALTANDTSEDRHRSKAAGMHDFISKPVKLEELRRTLIKWQSLGKSLRP